MRLAFVSSLACACAWAFSPSAAIAQVAQPGQSAADRAAEAQTQGEAPAAEPGDPQPVEHCEHCRGHEKACGCDHGDGKAEHAPAREHGCPHEHGAKSEHGHGHGHGHGHDGGHDDGHGHAPAPAPRAPPGHHGGGHGGHPFETVVEGETSEDDLVGSYGQPRWSTRRRFPTTRVYVIPAGQVGAEWWLEIKGTFDGEPQRLRSMAELEIGLGHRLQLDLYVVMQQVGNGPIELHEEKVELRYAFADWGVIPTNPTVYVEWIHQSSGPEKGELKLLLGDTIAPGWFWGANLVFARAFGGEEEHEYAITGGIAHTLVDRRFSIGAEVKLEMVDVEHHRFAFDTYEVLAGPSLQYLPNDRVHIDLVVPFGFEHEEGHTVGVLQPWDPLESTCRHASLSIL